MRKDFFEVLRQALVTLSQRDNTSKSIIDIPNLDDRNLRSYVEFLVQIGLLRRANYSNGQVGYGITQKGHTFLRRYEELRAMLEDEGEKDTRNAS